MYKAFFGLHSTPFNLSPDPSFLYRSVQHEEALSSLTYGVQSRKGFIVLTGEVGTGKTTMLECLRDHLTSRHTPFAFIFNSRLTPDQFFQMVAYDFDLPCTRTSKTEVLFALNTLLIHRANQHQTTVLIIDEAQNLTPKQMKALVTRAGPGTKLVCLGNIAQIDTPYLTEGSSGITYVVDRFKGWAHSGHVTLQRGERSRLADHAAEIL